MRNLLRRFHLVDLLFCLCLLYCFFVRCLREDVCVFLENLLVIFQIVFVLVEELIYISFASFSSWVYDFTCFSNPSAAIISCYDPTNVSEETDLITFYNKLSSLVCSISKYNILIIGGNMNAQIGKNVNHKFSLHNSSNRNGETSNRFHARK